MSGTKVEELYSELSLRVDRHSFDVADRIMDRVKEGLAFVAGFEGAKWLVEMTSSIAENAKHTEEMSQQLGISVEAVQGLGYAAKVTGLDAESMSVAMVKLARGMDEATHKGTGPAHDALRRLGVDMRDLRGETLDQNLEVIADAFARMPDGAEKAALATELFGRSGRRLIPLLDKGQAGIVELREEAAKLGVVIGKDGIKSLSEFHEQEERLSAGIQGLKNQAIVALAPELTALVKSMSAWVAENQGLIRSGISAFVHGLAAVFRVVGKAIKSVVEVVGYLADHAQLARDLMIAFGVAVVWTGRESVIAAGEMALAWVAALGPFVALVAAIAAVVAGLEWLYQEVEDGKGMADIWNDITDSLKKAWGGAMDWMSDKFHALIDAVRAEFEKVKNWMSNQGEHAEDKGILATPGIHTLSSFGGFLGRRAGKHAAAERLGLTFNERDEEGNPIYEDVKPEDANLTAAQMVARDHLRTGFGDVGAKGAAGAPTYTFHANFNITATAADAAAVEKQLREHHESWLRDAAAATGTGNR